VCCVNVRRVDLNASTSVSNRGTRFAGRSRPLLGADRLIARPRMLRRMTISTRAPANANFYVSYISEVPDLEEDLPHRAAFQTEKEEKKKRTAAARLRPSWTTRGRGLGQRGTPRGGRERRTILVNNSRSPLWRSPVVATAGERATLAADACRKLIGGTGGLNGAVTEHRAQRCWSNVRLLDEHENNLVSAQDHHREATVNTTFHGVSCGKLPRSQWRRQVSRRM